MSPAPTAPPDYATYPLLADNERFRAAADRALELKRLAIIGKAAEAALKLLNAEELEPELLAGGVAAGTTIDYAGARVRIIDKAGGSHIDTAKLVRLGVSKRVIAEATVEHKRQRYVDVHLPAEMEGAALREHGLAVGIDNGNGGAE